MSSVLWFSHDENMDGGMRRDNRRDSGVRMLLKARERAHGSTKGHRNASPDFGANPVRDIIATSHSCTSSSSRCDRHADRNGHHCLGFCPQPPCARQQRGVDIPRGRGAHAMRRCSANGTPTVWRCRGRDSSVGVLRRGMRSAVRHDAGTSGRGGWESSGEPPCRRDLRRRQRRHP